MKTYKGFDKNLKCHGGFQYEVGKEYEMEGPIKACSSGFHACEAPLDVFSYFHPVNGSRYCEVEQSGNLSRDGGDSKVASSKIKIVGEIGLPGLIKAQVEYTKSKATESKRHHTTGSRFANSATGDWSANSATGCGSANSATGYGSANSATGSRSANSATGSRSANSATGDWSANSATGYGSANVSTGSECKNDGAGERNISVSWGPDGQCKGCVGSFLVLSEWGEWDGKKYPFLGAQMVEVDGETIKADTWYTMKDGEIQEVTE